VGKYIDKVGELHISGIKTFLGSTTTKAMKYKDMSREVQMHLVKLRRPVQAHSTSSASKCHRAVQCSVLCVAEMYYANIIVLIADHLNRWHQNLYMVEYESNFITYCISQKIKGFNPSN
jgi:hypothetical protein